MGTRASVGSSATSRIALWDGPRRSSSSPATSSASARSTTCATTAGHRRAPMGLRGPSPCSPTRRCRRDPNPGMVAELLSPSTSRAPRETVWAGVLRVAARPTCWWPASTARPRSTATGLGPVDAVPARAPGPRPTTAPTSSGSRPSSARRSAPPSRPGPHRGRAERRRRLVLGRGRGASQVLRELAKPAARALVARLPGPALRRERPRPSGRRPHGSHPRARAPSARPRPYEDETRRTLLPAGPPTLAMHHRQIDQAVERGSRVVLTGQGGDEWFSGSPYALADDLRQANLRGLRRRAADDPGLGRPLPVPPARPRRAAPLLRRPHQPPARTGCSRGVPAGRRSPERLRPRPWPSPSIAASHRPTATQRHLAGRRRAGGAGLRRPGPRAADSSTTGGWWSSPSRCPTTCSAGGSPASGSSARRCRAGPRSVRRRGDKSDMVHLFPAELAAQGGADRLGALAIADVGWVHQPAVVPGVR